ncbi:MAG TPA: FAD-dependent oxidoreductase [Acidimicrobiia bacterium]|nr:FAD-dependent oxidoreductase [Acidimicrobiia bacterium]
MSSTRPSILAVDDEPEVLNAVLRDLRSKYGRDYRILGAANGEEAIATVEELSKRGEALALVVADQRMPKITGLDVLRSTLEYTPITRKVLLTAYADTEVAINAINEIGLDRYIMKPWDPPDEKLYPALDEVLRSWQLAYRPTISGLRVVSQPWSRQAHELKAFLAMNQVPYRSLLLGDQEADTLFDTSGAELTDLPLVALEDGEILFNPTNAELASRIGLTTRATSPAYDVAIVGGGPAGLAAAVYGASEGLRTVLIESSAPGGQAGQSSLIENYLGFPSGISGAELARRAADQARRFGAEILVPAQVTKVERKDPFRVLHLADGSEITTKALVIATGVSYRRLEAEGLDDFIGAGVYYGTSRIEAETHRGRPMHVVGGGNSAGQAALFLTRFTDDVNIVIRSPNLAATMSQYLIDNIEANPAIHLLPRSRIVAAHGDDHLESVVLEDLETGDTREVESGALFIFIGQRAHTDWLGDLVEKDEKGFVLSGNDLGPIEGWNLERDPLPLETSVPGVFVAGDVRHGSIRRVAGATGEGATAIRFVHTHLESL